LYWTAPGGGETVTCEARYRQAGEPTWHEALPLWFDPRNGAWIKADVSTAMQPPTPDDWVLLVQSDKP
jgi:hypothetical protein